MHTIKEGKVKIKASVGKISKKLEIFYNPVMKNNRDLSVLLLNCIDQDKLSIGLPMAASGIRAVRFIKELDKGKIKQIYANDLSEKSIKSIKENLKLNKIPLSKVEISQKDANLFMLESSGFNYIDIDPFGSPNPFLDAAVKRIARKGILAVTATDTAPLAGTFPKTCIRKYWANPMRTEIMHEIGLRILIRKVQLVGMQYEKALTPVFSYFKDHYFRIFFECEKGKKKCDKLIEQIGDFEDAGPLWKGALFDQKLAKKMFRSNTEEDLFVFLKTISEESKINTIGFYDIHSFCKRNKIKKLPRLDELIDLLKKQDYKASRTHFRVNSVRSDVDEGKFKSLLK